MSQNASKIYAKPLHILTKYATIRASLISIHGKVKIMKKYLVFSSALLVLIVALAACTGLNVPLDANGNPIFTDELYTDSREFDDNFGNDIEVPQVPVEVTREMEEITEPNTPDIPTPDDPADTEAPIEDTMAPEEETTAEETNEEITTADPADPIFTATPDMIYDRAINGEYFLMQNDIGSAEMMTEGKRTFTRLTSSGYDPYVSLIIPSAPMTLSPYMAISYRTNYSSKGSFYIGSGHEWTGAGDHLEINWNADNEWHFLLIDLSQTELTSIENDLINYQRFDFFDRVSSENDYIDVEYIAFFNSPAYAEAYDAKLHRIPSWEENMDIIIYQSFDELRKVIDGFDSMNTGIFTAGFAAEWDRTAVLDSDVEALKYIGWIAIMGEIGQFGYRIDDDRSVYDDEFTQATGDDILIAAMSTGADTGSRYNIAIPMEGLSGEHTIRTYYKNPAGLEVLLNEFTVILP